MVPARYVSIDEFDLLCERIRLARLHSNVSIVGRLGQHSQWIGLMLRMRSADATGVAGTRRPRLSDTRFPSSNTLSTQKGLALGAKCQSNGLRSGLNDYDSVLVRSRSEQTLWHERRQQFQDQAAPESGALRLGTQCLGAVIVDRDPLDPAVAAQPDAIRGFEL